MKKKMFLILLLIGGLVLTNLVPSPAFAAIPEKLNIQGVLKGGVVSIGAKRITVGFYNEPHALPNQQIGNLINVLNVDFDPAGFFTVPVDVNNNPIDFSLPLYVKITVNNVDDQGNNVSFVQPLLSVPYAITAKNLVGGVVEASSEAVPLVLRSGGDDQLWAYKTGSNTEKHTFNDKSGVGWRFFGYGGEQFSISNDGNVIYIKGRLGIGTMSPGSARLAVMYGNAGIGTTSPQKPLEISAGSLSQIRLTNPGTGGTTWDIGSSNDGWATGGGKLLFIPEGGDDSKSVLTLTSDAGRVGLGTTNPDNRLDVYSGKDAQAQWFAAADFSSAYLPAGSDKGDLILTRRHSLLKDPNLGMAASMIDFRATNPAGDEWSLAQIIASGDPDGGSNYKGGLSFLTSGGGNSDPAGRRNNGSAPKVKMTIGATGNVGIGTIKPGAKLEVKGNTTSWGGQALSLQSAANNMSWDFIVDGSDNLAIGHINDTKCRLFTDGNLFIKGSLQENSDIRLKSNIVTLSNVLDKVKTLRGVSFEWNDGRKPAGRKEIGLIAQEVEQSFPELVGTDDQGYKSLSYDKFSAVLLEAIKEQQAQIERLQQEVAGLKGR